MIICWRITPLPPWDEALRRQNLYLAHVCISSPWYSAWSNQCLSKNAAKPPIRPPAPDPSSPSSLPGPFCPHCQHLRRCPQQVHVRALWGVRGKAGKAKGAGAVRAGGWGCLGRDAEPGTALTHAPSSPHTWRHPPTAATRCRCLACARSLTPPTPTPIPAPASGLGTWSAPQPPGCQFPSGAAPSLCCFCPSTPSRARSPAPALPRPGRELLCCRLCLGSLISWCRPARWAWDAALQPLSEASPTSSLPRWPEGLEQLPQVLGWRGVLAEGTGGWAFRV